MLLNKYHALALTLWSVLVLNLIIVPFAQGQVPEKNHSPSQEPYQQHLQVPRQEGWLDRNIRKFRTFPHLDRAYKLMKADKLGEAREELEKYLAIDPQDLQGRYTYLVLLAKLKDYAEVIRQSDIILGKKPGFVPALTYRGLARQKMGQTQAARQDFGAVAKTEGVSAEDRRFALEMEAELALGEKDYDGALGALNMLDPNGKGYSSDLTRGFALEGLNRLPEANAAFQRAAAASRTPAERRQALLALGEVAKKAQDWKAARLAYQSALDQDPGNADLMRELGRIAYAQKDFAASSQWLSQAQKIAPAPNDQEFLINVWEAGKDYQAATQAIINRLQDTANTQDRYNLYIKLGHTYIKWGRPTQAVGAFREALRLKKDLPTLTLLANTLEKSGRWNEALAVFQEIAGRDPRGGHSFTLAELANRLGNDNLALKYYALAQQGPLPPAEKLAAYKQMGFIAARRQNWRQARQALEQAVRLSPGDVGLYGSLTDISTKMGDLPAALAYQQRLVTLTGRSDCRYGEYLENLGYLCTKQGHYEAAVNSFQQAIAAGHDNVSLRLNLGYLYVKLGNNQAALENFQAAVKQNPAAATFLAIGRSYKALQQPGVAVYYLNKARADASSLPKTEQIALFSTLGYLYADEAQYTAAALCFTKSLQLHYDPVIALRLARMERLAGQNAQALAYLDKIDPARLPADQRGAYREEKAAALQEAGELPAAAAELQEAVALADNASLHYRLGLLYRDLQQIDEAIAQLKLAHNKNPEDNNFAVALGYAYLKAKRYAQAGPLFEEVLSRDPDYLKLYEDLGYIHMKECRNDQAVAWFKRAIDNRPLYPIQSPEEAEKLAQDIYAFRKEITKITNRFDFTLYLSYRSSKAQQFNVPGGLLGGSVLADNGVELAYQPPVIGFRDERIFQGFVRVLWGNEPNSLNVESDTFQGGAGLRYKPLKTQNLWLSGERLFKIGDLAMDDWLVRLLYSWDDGYDLKYNKPWWNYTFLFAEGDYFFQGLWAYYWEVRQGLTINYRNKFLVTPHLIADMRYQDPCNAASAYLEGGAGLSLKYLYNETPYEINRSSLELLIHYKVGRFITQGPSLNGNNYNGVVVMAVNRF